jgi:surface polysaccharide O-acyltransferase-like enzyme
MTKAVNIDQMRVVATVSVVVLHVASDGLYVFDSSLNSVWLISHFYDSCVRFSVPLFVMMSGALLLKGQYNFYDFVQTRLKRILPPFLLWWSVYFVMNILFVLKNDVAGGINYQFLTEQIFQGSSYHLWYVYMIIFVYLAMPFIAHHIQKASNSAIIIWFICWVMLLVILTYLPNSAENSWFILVLKMLGYLGYAVLGYALYHKTDTINGSRQKYIGIAAFLVGSVSTFLLTYYFSKNYQIFDSTYYNYLTPNVCLQAIGVFLWLKNVSINWGVFSKYIKQISTHSYGIYLSHVLVIWVLSKLHTNIFIFNAWVMIPLISLATLWGSIQLLKWMRKITFLDKFTA